MRTGLDFESETLLLFCGWGLTVLGIIGILIYGDVLWNADLHLTNPQFVNIIMTQGIWMFVGSLVVGVSILTTLYIWSWRLSKQ